MTDFVVGASAVVKALLGKDGQANRAIALIVEADCFAPHLIDAKVGSVLRRHERMGLVSDEDARTALAALRRLITRRYPHAGRLAQMAWETRHTITFYDRLYVALATVLDLPLLTADVKLSRALA